MSRPDLKSDDKNLQDNSAAPDTNASPESRWTVLRQNLLSMLCILVLSGILSYFLIHDSVNTLQLAGVIKKSSSPELGAALISFLLFGLLWFLIELGIEPELNILGFKSPISVEKLQGTKYVFGLHKGLLAILLLASLIGLYLLPPDCNAPSILFRLNDNQNLEKEILALPGTTKTVQYSGPILISVIDIGTYLKSKSASIGDDLECDFEGHVSGTEWAPCYKILDVQPGPKPLVVSVRKQNCVNVSTFNLTLTGQ